MTADSLRTLSKFVRVGFFMYFQVFVSRDLELAGGVHHQSRMGLIFC